METCFTGAVTGRLRVMRAGHAVVREWKIPKPVVLVERALMNSSKGGDAVLDLFGGSGSTLIACEKLERSARLTEPDARYCDVIVKRWEDATGQKAVLNGATA